MQTKRRSTYERIVWEEGRDEGRVEGRNEGRNEGRLVAGRELLLDQLNEKFGSGSDRIRGRVEAIADETRLRQLARAILTVSTLQEFESLLGS